jgi:uncharacterized membrane protein (UPF0127 family)
VRVLSITFVLLVFLTLGCGETSERSASSRSENAPQETANVTGETTAESTKTAAGAARSSKLRTVTIDASNGEKVRVRVEIADDLWERVIGLRGRKNLAENRGMLFVYTEEDRPTFVMEDTLIPLSIAFMDSEGQIVDIQDMKALDDNPPHYVSAEPAQYALEVNQGFFEDRGVKVGDRAKLPV